jgi:hypothetical protein
MQDDLQAFRIYEMDKCFSDLQIPCRWVPDAGYGYGYPQFLYYPSSVYYIGAILHRIGFEYIDAVKILFAAGYLFSALAMFLLVKSILGKWPAFVAAILYSYVPYKAVEVYVRGALSEFWALTLFPLIFWAAYRLIRTARTEYLVWLALLLSLLFTTHALTAMIFLPFFALWLLFWLGRKWDKQLILKLVTSGLLGLGLAAFYLLPLLVERRFVHLETLLVGYFDYRAHFVSLQKLFLSLEWGYGSSGFPDEILNLSTGIVQWLIGGLAGVLALVNLKKEKKLARLTLFLVGAELIILFMMHLKSSFIWRVISPLAWLQFPWRFLSLSIFNLAILAGLAVHFAKKYSLTLGLTAIIASVALYANFFQPKGWLDITDADKFSGQSWEKQLTISIFDYLPIYAKLPPPSRAPDEPEILDGKAKFLSYKKGSNYQIGEVEVSQAATVRLPLFDFPGMEAKIDGVKVVHRNDDCRGQIYCLGLITFQVPAGRHTIEARLTKTPARRAGDWLSLASLGIVIYLLVIKNAKKIFS